MKHLGDICKINGAEIEPVDCITGGSPCQDLSIAGKRAGLAGERSGLFMEQVRIVKEMRERDRRNGRAGDMVRPRFLVWENVPGAFSSNGGGDFQAVLEEIIHIAEPTVSVPRFEGKWTKAGAIDGDGWSIAWRTHDAQYWGVPQRRRRISVVADFGGQSAREILFERQGLPGAVEPGEQERERPAGAVKTSTYIPDAACNGKGYKEDVSYTLNTVDRHAVVALDMTHACDVIRICGEISPSLQARMWTGGNQIPLAFGIGNGQVAAASKLAEEKSQTLDTMHDQQAVLYRRCAIAKYQEDSTAFARRARDFKDYDDLVCEQMAVRRFTTVECERLQGFPDGWTDIGEWIDDDGRTHKQADSPRYKALGNSIALPFWYWMLCRMAEHLPEKATLGSLFDGIGGFPLCWESIHGKGTARWASEIEKFPIAVTKLRFPEDA
nr:MAG TPA: Cytosine specific methyltransferase [Caudoviricetes sp.]